MYGIYLSEVCRCLQNGTKHILPLFIPYKICTNMFASHKIASNYLIKYSVA